MTVEMPSRKKGIEKPVAIAVEGKDYFYTLLNQIKDAPDLQDVQLWDFMELGRGKLNRWLSVFKTLATRVREEETGTYIAAAISPSRCSGLGRGLATPGFR